MAMLPCKMSGSCGVIIITSFERSEVKRKTVVFAGIYA
jgi:hypothetical protein